ncbi:MAG: FG-GAP repeat protein, partial [Myxococcaceae bacterium]|nr:FG-GAP repeat protein [Myxococcaceae bacterium]
MREVTMRRSQRVWVAVALGVLGAVALSVVGSTPSPPTPPAVVAPVAPPMLAGFETLVRAEEYRPSMHHGVLSAPNRAQGLRLRWEPGGTRIEDRRSGAYLATLTTVWVGRAADDAVLPAVGAVLADGRVERRWGGVTEWWKNGEAGAEQGWTVARRPSGAGPLRVIVGLEGATATGTSAGLELTTPTGRVLAYGRVSAFDATGRALATAAVVEPGRWRLEVDDAAAEYPVTVDPLLTAVPWRFVTGQQNANVESVASAGDFNGDGYSDVVVGSPGFDDGSSSDTGRVFLFLGSAGGVLQTPAAEFSPTVAGSRLGLSVAGAGDVNGDGFADVIAGAPGWESPVVRGRALLFNGNAAGRLTSPTVVSQATSGKFGDEVASAGDVNGDGYSDVAVVEIPWVGTDCKVHVYNGNSTGLSMMPRTLSASGVQCNPSAAGAGDVNGDGFSDLVVGLPTGVGGPTGGAVVYLGSPVGLADSGVTLAPSPDGGVVRSFGSSVASAGDVNGDGLSDVVVGASGSNRAYVFHGLRDGGLQLVRQWLPSAMGVPGSANFGKSVASAGDVNGDGFSDVLVGSPETTSRPGEVSLYLGSATGLANDAGWVGSLGPAQSNANFGFSVASAGDVNGDGYSDFIVGARQFAGTASGEGAAFVYLGDAAGRLTLCGSHLSGQREA